MNSSLQMTSASLRGTGGDVVLITTAFLDATLEGSGSCKKEASGVCGVNVRPAELRAWSELIPEFTFPVLDIQCRHYWDLRNEARRYGISTGKQRRVGHGAVGGLG